MASGPAIAVECKFFGDVKAVSDKIRSIVSKEHMIIITGGTPMRQLVEEIPTACLKVLIEAVEGDHQSGKGDQKNKGKGDQIGKGGHNSKGGKPVNKFSVWYPLRPSDPGFSIHYQGSLIVTSCLSQENMEQDVVINTGQKTGIDTNTLVEMIKNKVARVSGLYAVTIGVVQDPKAFGRRPKGL